MKVNKQKNLKQGFTLLELLVVVLIIGILAAIALPQYKMAVAKSKYNSIKEMTESIAQSVERYYLATGTPAENLSVLDIDIPGEYKSKSRRKLLPNGSECGLNAGGDSYRELICITTVPGDTMIAYLSIVYYNQAKKRKMCYAFSTDTTSLTNKICQMDTGKNTPPKTCSTYCPYEY